jgi:HEAT repeat protein
LIFLRLLLPMGGAIGGPESWARAEGAKVTIQLLEEQLNQLNGEARDTAGRLGKEALPTLLKRYPGESPRGRALVLECLAEVKGDEAVRTLVQALRDEEPDVRNTALRLLHRVNSPSAVGPLTALISQSPHPRVRGEVARILGRMGATSSLPALKKQAAAEPDPEAARKINLAMARLGDGPARIKVLEGLASPEPKIRYYAIGDLEFINDPRLLPHLLPLLDDESRVVNIGQERWPLWHRVCDRAVDAAAVLSGKPMPFPVGKRNYSKEEIQEARQIIGRLGK